MKNLPLVSGLLMVAILVACAPAAPSGGRSTPSDQVSSAPKRFTAAIRGNPHTVYQKLNPRSNIPGIDSLEQMVSAGLTVATLEGRGRLPRLAEAAPTIENGGWKLLPDGRMDVTWTIKEGAVWHDGVSFTANDVVFTTQVLRDKRL